MTAKPLSGSGASVSGRGNKRPAALVALSALVLAAIVGCDSRLSIHNGPVAVKFTEGGTSFAICEAGDLTYALVQSRGETGGWSDVWEATGRSRVSAGDDAPAGSAFWGLEAAAADVASLDSARDVMVVVRFGSHKSFSASFVRPAGGWTQDVWIHPDGSESATPCAHPGSEDAGVNG